MRRRQGLTLIELLISLTMTTIIVAVIAAIVRSQTRFATNLVESTLQVSEVAAAQQMLRDEIADLPRGAVTLASRTAVEYRFPVRWGIVCGPIDRHILPPAPAKKSKTSSSTPKYSTTTALQFSPDAAELGSPEPEGLALSANGVNFDFYPLSSWSAAGFTPASDAATACLSGAASASSDKKKPGKKDALPPPPQVVVAPGDNYVRSASLVTLLGGEPPEERTLIFGWITVKYEFRDDGAGGWALFRTTKQGTQRLAAPFAASAGFSYRLQDGTVTTNAGSPALIRAVRAEMPALRRAGQTSGTLTVNPWFSLFNAR